MPVPDFVAALRARVGHELLWLSGVTAVVLHPVGGTDHVLPTPLAQATRQRLSRTLAFRAEPSAGPYFVRP